MSHSQLPLTKCRATWVWCNEGGDVKGAPLKVIEGGGKGGGGWCLGQCRMGVWQENLLGGVPSTLNAEKPGRCKRLLANAFMAAVDGRAAHCEIHGRTSSG